MHAKPVCRILVVLCMLASAVAASAQAQPTNAYFVADGRDNNTRVYSVASNQLLETLRLGSSPTGLAISSNQRLAFFSYINSNYISVADLTGAGELTRINLGVPSSLALSADGATLAASASTSVNGNSVAIVNTGTFGVTQVSLSGQICDSAAPPNCPAQPNTGQLAIAGQSVYVSNGAGLQVAGVNLGTQQIIPIQGTVSTGAIVASPEGRYIIESDQGPTGGGGLGVIDSTTNTHSLARAWYCGRPSLV